MTKKCVTVVHCWSAPRSRSTALCYSFEARENTVALDEPLYTAWLRAAGDAVSRPYLTHLLTGIPPPGDAAPTPQVAAQWKRELLSFPERIQQAADALPDTGGVIFCKQMAKFCDVYDFAKEAVVVEGDDNITLEHKHLLLIRDPVAVLASWGAAGEVHGNNPTVNEVGIVPLLSIYSSLQSRGGGDGSASSVVVLDSDELAADPENVLRALCEELGIGYQDSM
jgi:protein-lysine N-methyltransferase EEF2KMT